MILTIIGLGLMDLESTVKQSDMIILAIPVNSALEVLPKVLSLITYQSVCDMCSTKQDLLSSIKSHPNRNKYVATHPMAGTEFSGPWSAISGLYDGKAAILCDLNDSESNKIKRIVN